MNKTFITNLEPFPCKTHEKNTNTRNIHNIVHVFTFVTCVTAEKIKIPKNNL